MDSSISPSRAETDCAYFAGNTLIYFRHIQPFKQIVAIKFVLYTTTEGEMSPELIIKRELCVTSMYGEFIGAALTRMLYS